MPLYYLALACMNFNKSQREKKLFPRTTIPEQFGKLAWNKTFIRYRRLDDATVFQAHTKSFYEFILFHPISHHQVHSMCMKYMTYTI